MAERYQQFFIIALAEPILVTGLTFASGKFGADRGAATLVAFATTAPLWRIYMPSQHEAARFNLVPGG